MEEKTLKGDEAPSKKKRKLPWWGRIIKWVVIVAVLLVVLVAAVIGGAVWIMTPEKLTPLVEKYGTEYLIDAELKVKRVELTYWSSWPRLKLDVDSLEIISHTLDGKLTESELERVPVDGDSLLRVAGFHGSVNLLELLRGRISLNNVIIKEPQASLVDARADLSNYDIFPKSPQDTSETKIPDIAFRKFEILGAAPIRYVSLPDSIDFGLTLTRTDLEGVTAPAYVMAMNADAEARVGALKIDHLKLGMGGEILWRHDKPMHVELKDLQAGVNNIHTVTSAEVDFTHNLVVESLDFRMTQVAVDEFISLLPNDYRSELEQIDNNLEVAMSARLLKPWSPEVTEIPTMHVSLTVPQGWITYDRMKLKTVELDVEAYVDGDDVNKSTVDIKKMVAIGEGVGFGLTAHADNLLKDPHVKGTFKGGMKFQNLPQQLTDKYGLTVSGHLTADAEFDVRESDLSRNNFHRLQFKGDAKLTDFHVEMPMLPLTFYTHEADFKLGTASSFVRGETSVDSMLTASIKIDTLSCFVTGMQVTGAGWRAGVGTKNLASSADTSQINPIGAVLGMDRLHFKDATDTLMASLHTLRVKASVRRFRDMAKVPLLSLDASIERARYADQYNRASLREATFNMTARPTPPRMGGRMRTSYDSLARKHPRMSPDSIYLMARRDNLARRDQMQRRAIARDTASTGYETIDFDVDTTVTNILRSWRARGHVTAKRGRVLTPYFPIKNRLRDLDMTFTNDSLIIKDTKLLLGGSDFFVNGTVSNIERGLTTNGRSPMEAVLVIKSDTVDVNELASAAFAGAAFMNKIAAGVSVNISDSSDDDAVQNSISQAVDTTETGPLLLPVNIRASLRLDANTVRYSDFDFGRVHGEAALYDGALNLRDLRAYTDIGSIDLTALYEGIDRNNLNFAFGMQVDKLRIKHFITLIPALDSIMPMLSDVDGIIDAEVAFATGLDTLMDVRIPTMQAALTIHGDSLVLMDAETFKKIGKWLLFKDKNRNLIDSMTVRMTVENGLMQMYPFVFNFDRYKLGVYGSNDLEMNFKYHVAVLKSPIPFKFGINISGDPDNMKIRLGGAKFDEHTAITSMVIADTTRINLINQIENVFRRGIRQARDGGVHVDLAAQGTNQMLSSAIVDDNDIGMAPSDSLYFMNEGLIEKPDSVKATEASAAVPNAKSKKKK